MSEDTHGEVYKAIKLLIEEEVLFTEESIYAIFSFAVGIKQLISQDEYKELYNVWAKVHETELIERNRELLDKKKSAS